VTAAGVAENRIVGTAAANTLNGTAGNDYIDGGAGKDTSTGLAGNDVYRVDDAGDKVVEAANAGTDTVYTTLTSLSLSTYANVENLAFIGTGAFNGTLSNLGGTLIGGAGADKLAGGNGNDMLEGLAGNDNLSGGTGNDTLVGGGGTDTLTGGTGVDTFAFSGAFGADIVTDFTATGTSHDWIQLPFGVASSFAALQAAGAVSQVGADVVIRASATDTVTVQKVTVAAISGDFQFT
jgi:Ca2+-binding RTX toxin-like protein